MCICSARFDATGARRETVATPRHRGWLLRTRGHAFLAGGDFSSGRSYSIRVLVSTRNRVARDKSSCYESSLATFSQGSAVTLSTRRVSIHISDNLSYRSLCVCSTSFASSSSWSFLRHPISVSFSRRAQRRTSIQNFPFLTHWRMAGNGVPVLLVTANVGSIFEEVSFQDFLFSHFSLSFHQSVCVSEWSIDRSPRFTSRTRHDLFFFLLSSSSFSFFFRSFFFFFFFSTIIQSQLARLSYDAFADNAMPIFFSFLATTLPSFITFPLLFFSLLSQCKASRFYPRSRTQVTTMLTRVETRWHFW